MRGLGDLERRVMDVLWDSAASPQTGREVADQLPDRAYTTVLTMMKVLEQKGYVKKTRTDRAFVYRSSKPRATVIGGMVREFVDRVFDGASRPMLLHLVREARLTEKERKALLRAIEEVEE